MGHTPHKEGFKRALPEVQLYYALATQRIVKRTKNKELKKEFQEFLRRMDLEDQVNEYSAEQIVARSCYPTQQKGTDGWHCFPEGITNIILGYSGPTKDPLEIFLATFSQVINQPEKGSLAFQCLQDISCSVQ